MFALNETTLAIITFISGCLSFYMLILMIDEVFAKIDKKLDSSEKEKKAMNAELVNLKSENDELLNKIHQMSLTIDELHTEINRVQSDEELLEENKRLTQTCEKLHLKCYMLRKELELRSKTPKVYENEIC